MTPAIRYRDRTDAGRALARILAKTHARKRALVLALPRGGVPIGLEISRALDAPLDVSLVRKLGHPRHEELAIGAIASGGIRLLDEALIAVEKISPTEVDAIVAREFAELRRREAIYRSGRRAPEIACREIILVDDGIATGFSIRVVVRTLKRLRPAHITIAAPVGPPDTCNALAAEVDELVCPLQPSPFHAVGLWYDHFPPLTDEEVCDALAQAAQLAHR